MVLFQIKFVYLFTYFCKFFSLFVIPIFHSLLYSYFYWLSVNMKVMASAISGQVLTKPSQTQSSHFSPSFFLVLLLFVTHAIRLKKKMLVCRHPTRSTRNLWVKNNFLMFIPEKTLFSRKYIINKDQRYLFHLKMIIFFFRPAGCTQKNRPG